jgi:uncharacterized protein with gpF-like domain
MLLLKWRAYEMKIKKTRAIHANAGVRAWYQHELDKQIQQAHAELITELTLAWNKTPPGIAQDAPSPAVNINRTLKDWGKKWTLRFDKLSLDLSKKFADKNFRATQQSMRTAFKEAGFTIAFKPSKASIEAYRSVVAENVSLIKSIPQRYLTNVESAVWNSVNKGGDMATLSRKLMTTYGSTAKRAALIARDQNNKAKAIIEKARRLELGIKTAIWQHSHAGKEPRPSHVTMNGKEFDIEKGMWDKDEGEFIQPGELINCRCTSRARIPGFA